MLALIKSSGFDSIPIPPPLPYTPTLEDFIPKPIVVVNNQVNTASTAVNIQISLQINWSNIVARFEKEFGKTFSKSKKAHFDCLPKEYKVVDGARIRWFPLLLLDAIIFILHNNFFRFATRRAFNQLEVLYECILAEVQEMNPEFYTALRNLDYQDVLSWPVESSPILYEDMSIEEQNRILTKDEQHNLAISLLCAAKLPNVEIRRMDYPWGSIEELKNRVIEDPPSKSKQKFFTIIDYLSRHHSFTQQTMNGIVLSFQDLLKATVCKVLAYFGSNRALLAPTMISLTPTHSSHSTPTALDARLNPGLVPGPIVITPQENSPNLTGSSPKMGEERLLMTAASTISSSNSIDDYLLPPASSAAGTVIAPSHQLKRKRSPRSAARAGNKSGRSHYQDIVHYHEHYNDEINQYSSTSNEGEGLSRYSHSSEYYSEFMSTIPQPTTATTKKVFTPRQDAIIASSFINPFLYEEQELQLSELSNAINRSPSTIIHPSSTTINSNTVANGATTQSMSFSMSVDISQDISSSSWEGVNPIDTTDAVAAVTAEGPMTQLSHESFFNISTDTIDFEEEQILKEEKMGLEENEEFDRKAAESATNFFETEMMTTTDQMPPLPPYSHSHPYEEEEEEEEEKGSVEEYRGQTPPTQSRSPGLGPNSGSPANDLGPSSPSMSGFNSGWVNRPPPIVTSSSIPAGFISSGGAGGGCMLRGKLQPSFYYTTMEMPSNNNNTCSNNNNHSSPKSVRGILAVPNGWYSAYPGPIGIAALGGAGGSQPQYTEVGYYSTGATTGSPSHYLSHAPYYVARVPQNMPPPSSSNNGYHHIVTPMAGAGGGSASSPQNQNQNQNRKMTPVNNKPGETYQQHRPSLDNTMDNLPQMQ